MTELEEISLRRIEQVCTDLVTAMGWSLDGEFVETNKDNLLIPGRGCSPETVTELQLQDALKMLSWVNSVMWNYVMLLLLVAAGWSVILSDLAGFQLDPLWMVPILICGYRVYPKGLKKRIYEGGLLISIGLLLLKKSRLKNNSKSVLVLSKAWELLNEEPIFRNNK